jgi:predicted dithiol-disulfide oxidoreductase (DUF899 family)
MPPVVDLDAWHVALAEQQALEKAHTRAGDAVTAARKRLPMVRVADDYRLQGPDRPVPLLDLFEGRRQLVVYHHMLAPQDAHPCPGCCGFCDTVGRLEQVHLRDISFAVVARAPFAELEALRERMEWTFPVYSSEGSTFTEDLNRNPHGPGSFGLGVFLRDGEDIYLTYFTQGRGVESVMGGLYDVTPYGRQESFEDVPDGWPQLPTYSRGGLHDELTAEQLSGVTMPSSAG